MWILYIVNTFLLQYSGANYLFYHVKENLPVLPVSSFTQPLTLTSKSLQLPSYNNNLSRAQISEMENLC